MSPSPSSCSRCLQPIAVDAASGLCASCSKQLETSKPEGTPDGNTRTWGGETTRSRLRAAPAGYDLFRYLGGGGMGDVFLAREHAAERTVAMKFLRSAANPASVERFLTEVRALARIDHPNIVRFYAVDLDRPDPHFTMEYAAGGTLAEHVKAEGPLPVREAAEIGAKLARAIHAAHQADILHRDLKPSNIVVAADGTPKLSDFGLAKRTDIDEELTRTTQSIGTPAFMPPEQISRSHGEFGPASDVYGLGATLYYLLTGRPPFDDAAQDVIFRQVRFDPPTRLRSLRAEVPRELEAIVLKCLEKNASDRYPSGAKLADDLEGFLAGQRPDAPILTPARRAKLWVKRHRASIAFSFLGVVALAVTFILGFESKSVPPPPVDLAEEYRKELAAGRAVTLVPEKGLPPWFRIVSGRASITEAKDFKEAEGAAAMESLNASLIELLPDPGIDRYVVKAELMFLDRRSTEERKDPLKPLDQFPTSRIGLYIGGADAAADQGATAHTFFALNYREFIPFEMRKITPTGDADFSPGVMAVHPDLNMIGHMYNIPPSVRFPLVDRLPGRWWPMRFEVTKDGVRAFFGNRQIKENKPFSTMSAEAIQQKQEDVRRYLATERNLPYAEGTWSPRQSIGLWTTGATAAFRKIIVEPLP